MFCTRPSNFSSTATWSASWEASDRPPSFACWSSPARSSRSADPPSSPPRRAPKKRRRRRRKKTLPAANRPKIRSRLRSRKWSKRSPGRRRKPRCSGKRPTRRRRPPRRPPPREAPNPRAAPRGPPRRARRPARAPRDPPRRPPRRRTAAASTKGSKAYMRRAGWPGRDRVRPPVPTPPRAVMAARNPDTSELRNRKRKRRRPPPSRKPPRPKLLRATRTAARQRLANPPSRTLGSARRGQAGGDRTDDQTDAHELSAVHRQPRPLAAVQVTHLLVDPLPRPLHPLRRRRHQRRPLVRSQAAATCEPVCGNGRLADLMGTVWRGKNRPDRTKRT